MEIRLCKGGGRVKEDSSAERKAQRTMMDEPTMQSAENCDR